jgi:hypothetical protein
MATKIITVQFTYFTCCIAMMFQFFDPDSEPSSDSTAAAAPGKVRFDSRGNAIYEWQNAQLIKDGAQADKQRERALYNPTLSLVDDGPPLPGAVMRNDNGLRVGYSPYESGQLNRKPIAKKRDIRELSKWIELQRSMGLLNKTGAAK